MLSELPSGRHGQQYVVNRVLQPSATVRYTLTPSAPAGTATDPCSGQRVGGLTIDGTPVDPAGTYHVTVNRFLAGGGDGFTVLTGGTGAVTGSIDLDAFVAYLQANRPRLHRRHRPDHGRLTAAPPAYGGGSPGGGRRRGVSGPGPVGQGEEVRAPDREDVEPVRRLRATTGAAPLLALAACAFPGTEPAAQIVDVPPVAQAAVTQPQADTASCTGADGYRVRYPADWSTNEASVLPACSWFGPGEVVVPEASDVRTAPVTLQVVDRPLAEVAASMPDEVARTELQVGGRPAVRTEQATTLGLYPEGTRITTWALDLGDRTLLADAVELPGGDHERAVAALDEMVGGLHTADA